MEINLALGCGKQCEYAAINTGRGLRAELSDVIGAAQSQQLGVLQTSGQNETLHKMQSI